MRSLMRNNCKKLITLNRQSVKVSQLFPVIRIGCFIIELRDSNIEENSPKYLCIRSRQSGLVDGRCVVFGYFCKAP